LSVLCSFSAKRAKAEEERRRKGDEENMFDYLEFIISI
jgi:hypothetical protein